MRINAKFVALLAALCLAVSWTYANQSGDSDGSPRLISVALSIPQNPLPSSYLPPAPTPQPVYGVSHNTFRGTAWSGYLSEPYHYQCGGASIAPAQCNGGCDACDFDPSANCVHKMFSIMHLLGHRLNRRHCATCDACDELAQSSCDECTSAGAREQDQDENDYYHDAPPEPEEDTETDTSKTHSSDPDEPLKLDSMEKKVGSQDAQPAPMDKVAPKANATPKPKKPAVTPPRNPAPPRNPLPKGTQTLPRLILDVPASFDHPEPQPSKKTTLEKTTLRFRQPSETPQGERAQPIRLLSSESK